MDLVTATTSVLALPVQSAYTPTTLLYGVTPTNLTTGTDTAVTASTLVGAAVSAATVNDQVVLTQANAYTLAQIALIGSTSQITGIDGGVPTSVSSPATFDGGTP